MMFKNTFRFFCHAAMAQGAFSFLAWAGNFRISSYSISNIIMKSSDYIEVKQDGSNKSSRRDFLDRGAKATGYIAAGSTLRMPLITGITAPFVDMSGKKVIITGGNSGLGFETAISLAKMGADVVIACRNQANAEQAVSSITRRVSEGGKRPDIQQGSVRAMELDLASMASIRTFHNKYSGGLDVLVNNAGVMAIPTLERTEDGFERQMGVNHLGHFLLTGLLMDKLLASPDGRVINVSSEAHKFPPGVLNSQRDINFNKVEYAPWVAYGQSKLANLLFTRELNRKLKIYAKNNQPSVTTMAVHPGGCRTDLGRYLFDPKSINPSQLVLAAPLLAVASIFTKSAKQGAQTSVKCASDPHFGGGSQGGKYFLDCHVAQPSAPAQDDQAAAWLWEESENLTGFQYKL